MQRKGATFSSHVLVPKNPKSNNTTSCPLSCASSIRFRQCGSSFARDATQTGHLARNGVRVAECKTLSNSLVFAGAFFTRAPRPSLPISMSTAFTGLATSAIPGRPTEDQLSPTVSQGSRLTTSAWRSEGRTGDRKDGKKGGLFHFVTASCLPEAQDLRCSYMRFSLRGVWLRR